MTGITAQVARTIIQLGVDVSTMYTLSRLAEGIELALSMVGKSIGARRASAFEREARGAEEGLELIETRGRGCAAVRV